MTEPTPTLSQIKNQWLSQQVDVKYPTPESLSGRKLYLAQAELYSQQVLDLSEDADCNFSLDDIFLVDFHRLTVLFAVLQSKRWTDDKEQELIVEFLTQIIYSEPCSLYVAFADGEPKAAAIVTCLNDQILVSDVIMVDQNSIENQNAFATLIINKLDIDKGSFQTYIEMLPS